MRLTYVVPRTTGSTWRPFGHEARAVASSRQQAITGVTDDRLRAGADTAVQRMTDLLGNRPWFGCPHRPACPACVRPGLWQLTPNAHRHRRFDAATSIVQDIGDESGATIDVREEDDPYAMFPNMRKPYSAGRMLRDAGDPGDDDTFRRVEARIADAMVDPGSVGWKDADSAAFALIDAGPDPSDPTCPSSPDADRVAAVRTMAGWSPSDVRPAADAFAAGLFRTDQEMLVPPDLDGTDGPDHARRVLTAARDLVETTATGWVERLHRTWGVPQHVQWNAGTFGDLVPGLFDRWFADLLRWATPHPQVLAHVAGLDDDRAEQLVGLLDRTGFAVDAETVATSAHESTVVLMTLL